MSVNMTKSEDCQEELEQFKVSHHSLAAKPDLKGDWWTFLFLILLYTIQGLPLGLAMALPIIFQSQKKVTYGEQAFFSLVTWPYTIKLIWAPIVDSLFIKRIGRRKSWLLPTQYFLGAFLFFMATKIDGWMPESGDLNLRALMFTFLVISFLAATQDIVVDGWALTMLKKNNVGHASTCNGTGLALGVLIGSVCPVLLTSEDFCNSYFRTTHGTGGIITIKGFLYFWSVVVVLLTTLVGIFIKEKDSELDNRPAYIKVIQSYKLLWDILKLPNMRALIIALLTMKIGFSATDSVSKFKLIDAGISKDTILIIQISMYLVKFTLPLIVFKYTSGPKPMSAYMNLMPIRLIWSFAFVALIYFTPSIIQKNGVISQPPVYYYMILGFVSVIHEILAYSMYIFTIGFFSRISDSRFGGTYMTMLSTIANFGWAFSNSLALKMVDVSTKKKCSNDIQNNCSTHELKNMCNANKGDCFTIINGYYVEVVLCVTIGFVWYFSYRNSVKNLQTKSPSHWVVNYNQQIALNDTET